MKTSHMYMVPLIVASALFMENMDVTVIATSLPAMALEMGESPIALKLALTSYLVSLAIFIPVSGWMADRYGARTVFGSAIWVFMLGSVLCGVSHTLLQFVAARFLQGIGGAMMVPVGRLIIVKSIPKSELVKAISYLAIPVLLGPVMGPPLGGFITTYFHWRWIFFINIPIGLLGIYLTNRHIENLREAVSHPLDWIGFLLSATGCSALMFGLATLGRHMVSSDISLACLTAGIVCLSVYIWHALRCEHPLINFRLLSIATLRMNVFGGSLSRIGVGAMPFLMPLLFQLGFGLSPLVSGMLTCMSSIGAMFVKTITTYVLRIFGFRSVLIYNSVLCAISMAVIGSFTSSTPYAVVALVLVIGGCIRSLQFTSLTAIAYAEIDAKNTSQASTLTSVAQQLSAGLGVTIAGYVLQRSNELQGHASIVTADFWPAFLAMGILAFATLPFALNLKKNAGEELAGRTA